ncbi:MAG TPA: MarR family transcriptional regulator [Micromonosporaceae bacterium]|nr:MarR family transcriptional regulator [Micromonosporaceae bacterium]
MLISPSVWRALVDAGVTLVPLSSERVELRHGRAVAAATVVASPFALSPSDITALTDRHRAPGLLIVPSATPAAREAAEAAGWSWLVDAGQRVTGMLQIAGHRITIDDRGAPAAFRRRRPGRTPWGLFTVVRRLIERPYATQQELAALAGVSQPRVSQSLGILTAHGLVQRTPPGWAITDVDEVVRWWFDTYPGPGGIRTFWYGLDQPVDQARTVVELFPARPDRSPDLPAVAVSGDVAADFIAPWRSPTRAVVYAHVGMDLTEAGLTPTGDDEATLEFVVPRDPGVWPVAGRSEPAGEVIPLADALQILWDLRRSPGPDTEEAVTRFLRTLHARTRRPDGGRAA